MTALSDLIGVLIPGGIAGAVVLFFQAYKSWKQGRSSEEEDTIKRWQRIAEQAEVGREVAETDEANAILREHYWRQRAADLEYVIRQNGLPVPKLAPIPPRRRMRGGTSGTRYRVGRASSSAGETEPLD